MGVPERARALYFRAFQSLGAAHWVAQCWRWKTARKLGRDGLANVGDLIN